MLDQKVHVDIWRHWRLAEHGLEDLAPRALVWERDVNELVKAPGTEQGRVYDVRPAGQAQERFVNMKSNALNESSRIRIASGLSVARTSRLTRQCVLP